MIYRMIQQRLAGWEPTFSFPLYRAVLVGMVIAAFAVPLSLVAIPYLDMFNGMAVQPKGKPLSLYGTQSGQKFVVERLPVAGTLPMSFVPYAIEGNDESSVKLAEETLVNPVPPTMDVLRLGEHLYTNYCQTCHGTVGEGNGPIVGPGLFAAPPSLHTDTARQFKDGRIFHVISRGQNIMPHYADKLDEQERWAVVHYVRALQRALDPKPEDLQR
jgi:mono/diheme cytochrome c family protein